VSVCVNKTVWVLHKFATSSSGGGDGGGGDDSDSGDCGGGGGGGGGDGGGGADGGGRGGGGGVRMYVCVCVCVCVGGRGGHTIVAWPPDARACCLACAEQTRSSFSCAGQPCRTASDSTLKTTNIE
jgi:hypothetical protein